MQQLDRYDPSMVLFSDYVIDTWGSPDKFVSSIDANGNDTLSMSEFEMALKKQKNLPDALKEKGIVRHIFDCIDR